MHLANEFFSDLEIQDRILSLRSGAALHVKPETDPEAHIVRLLETEMHEQRVRHVVVTTLGTKVGHPYGNLFMNLGLDVRGHNDKRWLSTEPHRWFWVTAKTSDGRVLAVRWPSGVEG
jgi:hypothetical protein